MLIGQQLCYRSHEVAKITVLLPSFIALAACNLGTPELEPRFGLPIKRKLSQKVYLSRYGRTGHFGKFIQEINPLRNPRTKDFRVCLRIAQDRGA